MIIREAQKHDLIPLLKLYTQLHNNPVPEIDAGLEGLWDTIVEDESHHVLVGFKDGFLVCSCVINVISNLTHSQRPYALIENVITDENFRRRGYAGRILDYAKEIALKKGCYKIMLLTGSKKEETLRFYENAGFNQNDKTAFIMWLE